MNKKTIDIKSVLLGTLLVCCAINAQDKKTKKAKTDFNSYVQKSVIVYHPRRIKVNHPCRVKVSHLRRAKVNH